MHMFQTKSLIHLCHDIKGSLHLRPNGNDNYGTVCSSSFVCLCVDVFLPLY